MLQAFGGPNGVFACGSHSSGNAVVQWRILRATMQAGVEMRLFLIAKLLKDLLQLLENGIGIVDSTVVSCDIMRGIIDMDVCIAMYNSNRNVVVCALS